MGKPNAEPLVRLLEIYHDKLHLHTYTYTYTTRNTADDMTRRQMVWKMTAIQGEDGKMHLNRTIPSDEKSNERKLNLAVEVRKLRKKTSKPVVRRP